MATKLRFKTIYDHANPVSPHGDEVSLTDKQYKDECDINSIIKRYIEKGITPPVRSEGITGDFSDIGDFQHCLDKIERAKAEFEALPSEIRSRFGNEPHSYVDFVLDPKNEEECIRLGLKVRHEPPSRSTTEILESIEKSVTSKEEIKA